MGDATRRVLDFQRAKGLTDMASGIEQFIDNEAKGNNVVLFMKGTPQFPMCGFSGQVVQILDHLGVSYKGLNVLNPTICATGSRPIRTGRPSRNSTSKANSSAAAI